MCAAACSPEFPSYLSSKIIVSSPWYFFAISLVFALSVSFWLYFRNRKNSDAGAVIIWTMLILRFTATFILSLVLLDIFFRHLQNETENPIVIVATDNTSSIVGNADSASIKREFLPSFLSLQKDLSEKFTVRSLLFGSDVKTGAEATFRDKETDLDNLFKAVDNNYSNQNIGALVIASDGIYNKGANPVYTAEKLSFPVFIVALGDTSETRDLLIRKINHNEVVYAGNIFPVEVVVQARHYSGKDAQLSISEGGRVITNTKINISSEDFLQTCTFTLQAPLSGVIHYSVRLSILDGEKNTINNAQQFIIEVINNREKILLVANAPHPDVAAIREALIASPNYEFHQVFYPDLKTPLKAFSLVIIHGHTPAMAQLFTDCKSAMIPVWVVNPVTSDNLPGLKLTGTLGKFNDAEPTMNRSFGLFNMSEEFRKFVVDLPAVKTFFGNYSLTNSSNSLIDQKLGSVETDNPVLYFTDFNGLKSAAFIGEGLWRWKLRDFSEHKNNNLFNELISKTAQYLSVKSDKTFFRVNSPKFVNENAAMEITAEVYNRSYELVTDSDVLLTLTNSEDKKFNFTFSKNGNGYRLNLGSLPPGEYRYEAKTNFNNELFVKQGLFTIKEVIAESVNTVADHQVLFQLASRTGGKLFYPGQLNELKKELQANEKIKPVTYSRVMTISLIDLKWTFFFVVTLFVIEWLLRKRFLMI
jgi:hypothetical protein